MTRPLRDAARTFHARMRSFFSAPPDRDATPLELLHAVLEELETKVAPSGRGSRVFPYSRVIVHVRQPASAQPAAEVVFRQLEDRLRERLAEMRCEMPGRVAASVAFEAAENGNGPVLWVEYGSRDGQAAAAPADTTARLPLRLIVVKGECDRPEFTFDAGSVAIGRGSEPADAFGRVRRNDVAFLDARDGVNETVARAHARIAFDPELGAYLLFNESTSNPTFLLRDGRAMRVVPRDPRGVRLQSGDEVQLGRAIVRIDS